MPKIAFVFAGQGSQAPLMGKTLYDDNKAARAVFDAAGSDIKKLCFETEQDKLNLTINAQPCLFTVDLAACAALTDAGVKADGAAGFSLGEVPAAVHCGIFNFEQGLAYVKQRAAVMHACTLEHPGRMYAVLKLPPTEAADICEQTEGCYAVNFNCPSQTVAACAEGSAAEFEASVKQAGGKLIRLAASGAFHSPFMSKAAAALSEYLNGITLNNPQIPLYSNITAEPFGENAKELLAKQVRKPVLWQKTIENMINAGFDTFIELGPGKTLSGLIGKISSNVKIFNVSDISSLNDTLAGL